MESQTTRSPEAYRNEFEQLLGTIADSVKPGELIKGTVLKLAGENVVVDVGHKSEGYIPLDQFKDEKGCVDIKTGDQVEVLMIVSENEDGEIVLSRDRAKQLKTWLFLEEAFEEKKQIEGTVVQKVKGGLQVDVGVPAFLPGSQIDVRPQRNLGKFVGEKMNFHILKINKERGNIVLSRRMVLEAERNRLKTQTVSQLEEGVVLEGIVKNVTDYGAFIDLGGIDGLLHITDISWGRVNHPKKVLSVGQTVAVVILKYDKKNERISLGMKQLTENPWQRVLDSYKPGTIVKGEIVTITDYGAFVKLEDGIEGLIHISEMSWSKKLRKPCKFLKIGDEVEAKVLEVSPENQRISLGLKQLTVNPWDELCEQYPVGTKVKGSVRSIMDFGMFVNIKGEIDGLVHLSDFSWVKKFRGMSDIEESYKKGDEVEAIVLDIDIENERLSLGLKQLTEDIWETVPQRYPVGARVKGVVISHTDFGVFLELEEGVEGLIHISQLDVAGSNEISVKYPIGQEVESEVTSVEKEERRIGLSVKRRSKDSGKEDYARYMEGDGSAVTFGDLLQEQLEDKND